jgi:hypothetical protein
MEISDLKAFICANNIMILGDTMKELEIRVALWETESKNYGLQINLEKTVKLRLLKKEERNTIMKISGNEIKQVDRFTYLRSVIEEKQNEINKKTRKA